VSGSVATGPRESSLPLRLLVPLAATLVGLLLHGYRFGVVDQDIYLPLVSKGLPDARFHPADVLFRADVSAYSLFWWAVERGEALLDLERLLALLYPICAFAYLAAIGSAARAIGLGERASALATLLAACPLPVGGVYADPGAASIQTWNVYVTHRSAATAVSWASIAGALRGRWVPSLGLAGLVFSLHPVSAAPLLAAVGGLAVADRAHRTRFGRLAPLALLAGAAPFAILRSGRTGGSSPFAPVDPAWLEIVRLRNPYAFLRSWSPFAFAILLLFAAAALVSAGLEAPLAGAARRRVRALLAGVAVLCAAAFPFTDLHPLAGAVQFQVYRGLAFPVLLAVLLFARGAVPALAGGPALGAAAAWTAASLVSFDERLLLLGLLAMLLARARAGRPASAMAWIAFAASLAAVAGATVAGGEWRPLTAGRLALCGGAALGAAFGALALRTEVPRRVGPIALAAGLLVAVGLVPLASPERRRRRFDWPGRPPRDGWEEVQAWSKRNLGRALVVVPPERSGFRTGSLRSVLVGFKDGGAALLDREFAIEWRDRMKAIGALADGEGYRRLGPADFDGLAERFGATHVVVEAARSLPGEAVHRNPEFAVYVLPFGRAPR
jgi:hypothetical protein